MNLQLLILESEEKMKNKLLTIKKSFGTWRWKIGRLSGYIYSGRPPFYPKNKGRYIILGLYIKPKKSKKGGKYWKYLS